MREKSPSSSDQTRKKPAAISDELFALECGVGVGAVRDAVSHGFLHRPDGRTGEILLDNYAWAFKTNGGKVKRWPKRFGKHVQTINGWRIHVRDTPDGPEATVYHPDARERTYTGPSALADAQNHARANTQFVQRARADGKGTRVWLSVFELELLLRTLGDVDSSLKQKLTNARNRCDGANTNRGEAGK